MDFYAFSSLNVRGQNLPRRQDPDSTGDSHENSGSASLVTYFFKNRPFSMIPLEEAIGKFLGVHPAIYAPLPRPHVCRGLCDIDCPYPLQPCSRRFPSWMRSTRRTRAFCHGCTSAAAVAAESVVAAALPMRWARCSGYDRTAAGLHRPAPFPRYGEMRLVWLRQADVDLATGRSTDAGRPCVCARPVSVIDTTAAQTGGASAGRYRAPVPMLVPLARAVGCGDHLPCLLR